MTQFYNNHLNKVGTFMNFAHNFFIFVQKNFNNILSSIIVEENEPGTIGSITFRGNDV